MTLLVIVLSIKLFVIFRLTPPSRPNNNISGSQMSVCPQKVSSISMKFGM